LRSILDERPDELAVAEALVEAYTKLVPPRFADAETLVYTKMREFPKDPRWPKLLGRLGEHAQDWNKAIAGYEKAVELSRYQPETVTALFEAYKNAGRPQDIIRYATEKLTSRTLATAPEALSCVAWAYSRTNDETKCLETYDQALAAAGEDVIRATRVTGDMVRTLGKEAALARAKARADADPGNPDRKKVLVHLLFLNDKPDEALEVCREVGKLALNNGDSVFAELGEAMLLERLNRYPEAKAKYEAGLKLDPNNSLALNNLAFLLIDKLDNAAEALPYAERAKKLDPDNPNVLDTYGMVLAKKGRLGEALGVLLRALDINRDNVSVLYHLGLVHEQRGELEDAKARFLAAKGAAEAAEAARPGAKSPELPKINEALHRLEKVGG
jgi:tetratricopeptide (TPR) repeat protein